MPTTAANTKKNFQDITTDNVGIKLSMKLQANNSQLQSSNSLF